MAFSLAGSNIFKKNTLPLDVQLDTLLVVCINTVETGQISDLSVTIFVNFEIFNDFLQMLFKYIQKKRFAVYMICLKKTILLAINLQEVICHCQRRCIV